MTNERSSNDQNSDGIPRSTIAASALLLTMPTIILMIAALFQETLEQSLILVGVGLVLLVINAGLITVMRRWARATMEQANK